MNCPACGAQNASDARFCNMCGNRVAPETPLSNPSAIRSPAAMSTSGMRGAPDAMSSTQSVSLSAIGVQSSGRTYAVIGVVAAALVSAGALGMWLYGRSSPPAVSVDALPPPPADAPVVIGTPLPVGEEPPPVDFATGNRRTTKVGTTGRTTPPGNAPTAGTPGRSGTTAAHTSTATPRTGTTPRTTGTARPSGSGATAGGGEPGAGAAAGGGTTAGGGEPGGGGGESGSGAAAGGGTTAGGGEPGGGGGTATGGATDTIPADVGDERDIAAELYAGQVRRVIRQFYAARAQACFEHASRNTEIRGTVIVTFTIAPSGQVSRAAAERNTTGDEALGRCLAGEVGTWRLPAPGADPVEMSIPFSR